MGAFDTKGREFLYIKKLIETKGIRPLCVHTGVFEPLFEPEVSNAEVAAEAGADIEALVQQRDRATATEVLAKGLEKLIVRLYQEGRFDGILSVGGSGGTALATPAMRALPIGVPKVMVSTMASGNVSQYGGPIADPEDAAYIIKNVPEIDGFFGASSIERLASERGMTAQAAAFKAISK